MIEHKGVKLRFTGKVSVVLEIEFEGEKMPFEFYADDLPLALDIVELCLHDRSLKTEAFTDEQMQMHTETFNKIK